MFADRRDVRRVSVVAFAICAAAWVALLIRPDMSGMKMPLRDSMVGWFLMLTAMMALPLIPPICFIRSKSFASRRGRSVALFLAGYVAVWTAPAAVFMTVIPMKSAGYFPALVAGAIALLWHCSPVRQVCLNRCHANGDVAAFGLAADLSAIRLGLHHGLWCMGSCWALMFVPMTLPKGQLIGMAIATVLVIGDRMERPRSPSWRWRGTSALMHYATFRLEGRRSPDPSGV